MEPDPPIEVPAQDAWMEALRPIRAEEQLFYEADHDYDDLEFKHAANVVDWTEDARTLRLSPDDIKNLPKWLDEVKCSHPISRCHEDIGGEPHELNHKQFIAFAIVQHFIQQAHEKGLDNVPQLLLNISGAAGTGKTFWLNTVQHYAKNIVGSDFITAAAPSGTAAYLIGGETLHSLLYLPVGRTTLEPLQGDRLQDLQNKFSGVGILVIDEKSKIGQEVFSCVSQRQQEAKRHTSHLPFGGLSVILLGDWKQLPPVRRFLSL